MRIDRMLSIVITLLYKEKISARELAQKFEVSIRTVYRDIEAINRAGIPIVPYSGSSGGFGLMNNFKLDRRLLSMEDFIYIISSLKGINETLDNKEIENAIDKISSLIPKEKSELFDSQLEHIVFDMVPWGYAKRQTEKVKILHQAIINRQLTEFLYTDQNGKSGKRKVEPVSLVFKGSTWYLFGYCKTRNDFRIFRLSRINDLSILMDLFIPRKTTYKEFSQSSLKKEKLVKCVLKFHPDVRQIVEDYFDEKNITILKDKSLIVNAMFPEGDSFIVGLLSYGDKVEIIEPVSLRKTLLDITKRIFNLYNADIMVSK
jgi:predicted DNA-binding transcriptional regulator YafY